MTALIILSLLLVLLAGFESTILYFLLKTVIGLTSSGGAPRAGKPSARRGKLNALREDWRARRAAKEIYKHETVS